MTCRLCGDRCAGADLTLLLTEQLDWLWQRLADTADRRGDPHLLEGSATVTAPTGPTHRAAVAGLLGGRPLRAGQSRRVELAELADRLTHHGPALTPGAVAAHAAGRPLAVKAAQRAQQQAQREQLRQQLDDGLRTLPAHVTTIVEPAEVWARLRQTGALARLVRHPDPGGLVDQAVEVLRRLPEPGTRLDRRTLVPGRPHELDDGSALAGLVLALCGRTGRRPRHAWSSLGVDIDNLTGGLLTVGLHPAGWQLPRSAVVTLPPRELDAIVWATPPVPGTWAFVTENPSVLAAAADAANASGTAVRLLCTFGTPSAVENAAVGRLVDAGWRIALRADFDSAGLAHVRALLAAAPSAVPWRMSAADYRRSDPGGSTGLTVEPEQTPWDRELAAAISAAGAPAFEEALLPALLTDLTRGHPAADEASDQRSQRVGRRAPMA